MIAQQTRPYQSQKTALGRLQPVAAAFLLGFCLLSPANASGAAPSSKGELVQPAAAAAEANAVAAKPGSCICRALGIDHELGSTLCLRGPQGPRMAECVMVLNNTSWKFSDVPCALVGTASQPANLSYAGKRALSLALWAR